MSHATVVDILDRINKLPAEDRLLLDELLDQQEDKDCHEESAKARELAQNLGLDQEAIDRAVHLERLSQSSELMRFLDERFAEKATISLEELESD